MHVGRIQLQLENRFTITFLVPLELKQTQNVALLRPPFAYLATYTG